MRSPSLGISLPQWTSKTKNRSGKYTANGNHQKPAKKTAALNNQQKTYQQFIKWHDEVLELEVALVGKPQPCWCGFSYVDDRERNHMKEWWIRSHFFWQIFEQFNSWNDEVRGLLIRYESSGRENQHQSWTGWWFHHCFCEDPVSCKVAEPTSFKPWTKLWKVQQSPRFCQMQKHWIYDMHQKSQVSQAPYIENWRLSRKEGRLWHKDGSFGRLFFLCEKWYDLIIKHGQWSIYGLNHLFLDEFCWNNMGFVIPLGYSYVYRMGGDYNVLNFKIFKWSWCNTFGAKGSPLAGMLGAPIARLLHDPLGNFSKWFGGLFGKLKARMNHTTCQPFLEFSRAQFLLSQPQVRQSQPGYVRWVCAWCFWIEHI